MLKSIVVPVLRCWNHLFKSTQRWLTSKHIDRREQGLFCHHLRELMCQETKAKFDVKLEEFYNQGFDHEFISYFDNHILPDADSIAKYIIEPIIGSERFNSRNGITTNSSEGLNNLMKQVMKNAVRPVDILCLSFRQLSVYYTNEILLGLGDEGIIKL